MDRKPMFVEAKDAEAVLERLGFCQSPRQTDVMLANFFIFGISALVIYFTYNSGALGEVIEDLIFFYGGSPEMILSRKLLEFSTLQMLSAIIVLNILSKQLVTRLVWLIIGKPIGKNGLHSFFQKMINEGSALEVLFFGAAAEELIMRWVFLSVIASFFPAGVFSLYALIIVSSILFASTHLSNFDDPEDRHWARVLPQFLGGLFYCYVYIKFGLIAAILTHFFANLIRLIALRIELKM